MIDFPEREKRNLSKRGLRLLYEWEAIDSLCRDNKHISYIIRKRNAENLPTAYEIIYRLKSIVGVEEAEEVDVKLDEETKRVAVRKPVFGDEHRMRIELPNNYPSAMGNPELTFITDIWHPNVRSAGKKKGHVCSNERDLGVKSTLAERIIRIGKYLQYQIYHAEDTDPYPEDSKAAEWVREEAEPMGWVNMQKGLFVDYSNLYERTSPPIKQKDITKDKEMTTGESGKQTTPEEDKKPEVEEKAKESETGGEKTGDQGDNKANEDIKKNIDLKI